MTSTAQRPPRTTLVPTTPQRRMTGDLTRVMRNRQTILGIILLGLTTAFALIGPLVAPYSPTSIVTTPFAAPSSDYLLGGDALGRDAWSRVLFGGRELIAQAFAATVIGVSLGAILGLTAAYVKGALDVVLMRLSDVLLAFPTIVLALLFVSMLGASPWLLVSIVALSHVPSVARVIRGAALQIVDGEHILWARAVGIPGWRIVAREVAPLVTSPLMVEFGLRLMWSVGALASLSFLGYGTQPPAADWGLMVSENRNALTFQPFPVLIPIVLIALFTIGGNMIAEGVARALGRTEGVRS